MPKILYLVTQSEWGGAQKYVFDLATHLPQNEYDVLVAAGSGNGELFNRLKSRGIRVCQLKHTIRAIRPLKEILAVIELIKLFKIERPDIIHLNSSKIGILGSLAAKLSSFVIYQSPIVARHSSFIIYTAHGWVFNEPLPKIIKGLYLALEKWTAKYKDITIVPSEFDCQTAIAKKIAQPSKLIVINNGLGRIDFLDRQAARQQLAIHNPLSTIHDPRSTIIGTIANLYKTKGLEHLIKAAADMIKKRIDLLFMVIGQGPEQKKLAALIKINNLTKNFFLLGQLDQAARYLKAFDVFVLPSIKEGWPYTVLEALQAGLPVVATKVGGLPEIISSGHNGLLVKPANPAELARAIQLMLDKPDFALKLKTNALETVKRFDLNSALIKTMQIYQKPFYHFD